MNEGSGAVGREGDGGGDEVVEEESSSFVVPDI